MDVPIAHLAERSAKKDTNKRQAGIRIPFIAWVLFGIILAVVATSTPSGLIFRSSSLETTDRLTSEIILGTVREASREIINIMDRHRIILERLESNPVVKRHMITEFYDMNSNPDVNSIFLNTVMGSSGVESSFLCSTRHNLSGLAPPDGIYWNSTLLSASFNPQVFPQPFLAWVDFRTSPALMGAFGSRNGSDWALSPPFVFVPTGANPKNGGTEYQNLVVEAHYTSMKCYWDSKFTSLGTQMVSCFVNLRVGIDPDPKGTCFFALDPTRGFQTALDKLQGRLQRAIIVFNEDFDAISSSLPVNGTEDFLSREYKPGEIVSRVLTFDSVVVSLQKTLKAKFLRSSQASGDNTRMSNTISNETLQINVDINGTEYIVGLSSLNVTAYDRWVLAVMAPREQIYGPIDRANNHAIIVVVVVTFAVLIATAIIMFLIVKPLAEVATAMQKLTTFDFSVLEGGRLLNVNSLVAEITYIQETFTMMVKAFAAGIRTNKLLLADTRNNTSGYGIKASNNVMDVAGTPADMAQSRKG
ncbi:hypothetical protein HK102_012743 [Quaeritorhiza haematococci]|nr:hypothetical protein HK102_012743 [Quaeritorhiza haematococci]